ncbi:MAG: ATP-binding protein [Planctomycetia bacterium]|nr:ATP-binding protein [Planctomycetia bacterium]
MNAILDAKKAHEAAAVAALKRKCFDDARASTLAAAKCAYELAESFRVNNQKIAWAYVRNGEALLAQAKQIGELSARQTTILEDSGGKDGEGEETSDINGNRWMLERPTDRFDDVVGLDQVKTTVMQDLINPLLRPDVYKQLDVSAGGGAILWGPAGTGKTFIARAIAGEVDAAFFAVSGADIKSKWVGETEQNLKTLFDAADKYERAVIFFDEIQGILGRAGNQKVNSVEQFLQMVEGIKKRKNTLFLLGATNMPWLIDDAVIRRFGGLIYVDLPSAEERYQILVKQFPKVELLDQDVDLRAIADDAVNFSGSDLARMAARAKKIAAERIIETRDASNSIKQADLLQARSQASATNSQESLEKYAAWREAHENGGTTPDFNQDE